LAVELIERLSEEKSDLHIGVGGGFTTMLMARKLASLLPTAKRLPTKLTIHALSTGFDVHAPHTAPVAFLSCFDQAAIKIHRIGLFAPAVVASNQYKRVKGWPGVREAFEAVPSDGFDIVITSLGSASHPHGDFSTFMERGSTEGLTALRDKGWVGDVQYRPYSIDGPITDNTLVRTVTLLELDDLVALASKPNKHVIVVAGPCGQCGQTRSDAVYPLLANERLKLWSRFVMDIDTAKELLDMPIAA
jgi:DNA-binding transcriptional regulator LsrR (DeoR family)